MTNLSVISLLYDPDLFQKGEDLYKKNAVIECTKSKSNIYNTLIKDGQTYEVELRYPLSKTQKATCECSFYKENKTCRHIVAALLFFQNWKDEESNKTNANATKAKSITTKSLLSNVNNEDLRNFVLNYATKDKKFANALKVNFIRQVDIENNEKKYKTLLDSLIRPVTSKENSLKQAELRQFISIAQDLNEQAQDAIALGEFLEASFILKCLVRKLHYTLHYYPSTWESLKDIYRMTYVIISTLMDEKKLALELKKTILAELDELSQSSYHHAMAPLYNVYEVLLAYQGVDQEALYVRLTKQLKAGLVSEEVPVIYAYILILKKYLGLEKVFDIPKEKLPHVESILKSLIAAERYELALEAATYYHNTYPKDITYLAVLLDMLNYKNMEVDMVKTAAIAFVNGRDLRTIDLIKKYPITDVIEKMRSEVMEIMPQQISATTKAEALFKLEDWDGLMAHMYAMQDFRHLMKYDKTLHKLFPQELQYLYINMVEKYLQDYLGDHAIVFIEELRIHLQKNGMRKVNKEIEKLISEKFSHRTRLNDINF